jgi:hypothetical protein
MPWCGQYLSQLLVTSGQEKGFDPDTGPSLVSRVALIWKDEFSEITGDSLPQDEELLESGGGMNFKSGKPRTARQQETFNCGGEFWCAWQDLNLHGLRHYHLKVACLPIPPQAHDNCPIQCSLPLRSASAFSPFPCRRCRRLHRQKLCLN